MFKALLLASALLSAPLPAFTGPGPGKIDTFAGGGLGDGDALSIAIFNIRGMCFDSAGNLYFADTNHRRVRKLDFSTNIVTTIAGNGTLGYGGDGGPATSAMLRAPYGVGVDNAGNVYINDQTSKTIRKVDTSGIIHTICGTDTSSGVTGDGGAATAALLFSPIGMVVNGAGDVYIVDSQSHTVRKITAATGIISRVAGRDPNVVEFPPAYTDGIAATSAYLDQPTAIWVNSGGDLFIADFNDDVIRKVTASSGLISRVAGIAETPGTSDNASALAATMTNPSWLGGDNAGNLYVADSGSHSVRKVVIGGAMSTLAGTYATSGFSGDGGPSTAALLNTPRGLLAKSDGSVLYIADATNNRIRKVVASTGIITTVAGNGTQDTVGDGILASSTPLNNASALLRRKDTGDIYIVNRGSHTVLRVGANDSLAYVVAGTGTAGHTGDGGQATAAQLALPQTAAVDASGNLYILESGASGTAPYIRKVNTSGVISTIAGDGTVGYTASGTALGAQLGGLGTAGAACDSAGNLYFAEPGNHCIRKISTGGVLSTYAGVCQSAGFSGDGGAATAAQLNNPAHIYFDASNNLYIADSNNNRIRKVTAGGTISTVAGSSLTGGYTGDGAAATAAQLNLPGGVWVDLTGAIFISDRSNHVVRRVDPFTNFISTIAGDGTAGFSGDGGAALSGKLGSSSTGLTGDENGNLFIADPTNNRVRWVGGVVALPSPTNTPTPSDTPTRTASPTRTMTPTRTVTPTDTTTSTASPTLTVTLTATPSPSATESPTSTDTSSVTPTGTDTSTATDTPTRTATPTATDSPTSTVTPSVTSTSTETSTSTITSTYTDSPTSTETPTDTATDTETSTSTVTPTSTDSPTSTATPTDTDTATATDTSTASPSSTPSVTPTDTPTATDTATSTATVTPSATPTITKSFTTSPTPTSSPTPAWSQSGLGKAVLAPVPLKAGQPLCLYFDGTPIRSRWKVYGSDGARVADLSFDSELRQCWDGTAALAPGVYGLALEIDYNDGRHEARTQKVMVLR